MTELFHRHAELLEPLSSRLLARVAESEVVQADETSIKMLCTSGPSCPATWMVKLRSWLAIRRGSSMGSRHEEAGENLAGLYFLVATCEANGINPYEYLRDVLLRVSNHPAARVDELLPDQWKP